MVLFCSCTFFGRRIIVPAIDIKVWFKPHNTSASMDMRERRDCSNIRRSARRAIPTSRALHYVEERDMNRPVFPSMGDEIHVRWIVNSKVVWWPAIVTFLQPVRKGERECHGTLIYEKMGNYDNEKAAVVFSSSGPNELLVKTVNGSSSSGTESEDNSASSWKFVDESSIDDEDLGETNGSKDNLHTISSSTLAQVNK